MTSKQTLLLPEDIEDHMGFFEEQREEHFEVDISSFGNTIQSLPCRPSQPPV